MCVRGRSGNGEWQHKKVANNAKPCDLTPSTLVPRLPHVCEKYFPLLLFFYSSASGRGGERKNNTNSNDDDDDDADDDDDDSNSSSSNNDNIY